MQTHKHAIAADESVATFQLTSFHFGSPGGGPKVYIQAALHADEPPGMLVAHLLRGELEALEAQGRVRGEVILVPAANPIGLSQVIHGAPFGRFDLSTGVNFNRAYRHVAEELKTSLQGQLGADAGTNVATIRAHARRALDGWTPPDPAGTLKKTLLGMAIDADIVLDLHCDNEAVMHVYAGTPLEQAVAPLAALVGAHAVLLSRQSGGEPFDEACSRLWWDLAEHFGDAVPIPQACMCATVELRGEMDVSYALARRDADALLQYMAHQGVLDIPLQPLPQPLCAPTPLEGVTPITAPHAGVLAFLKNLGDRVEQGEAIAELVNPVSGTVTPLVASHAGVFFARTAHRHLLPGMHVCKIAGATAFRSGDLLSQ